MGGKKRSSIGDTDRQVRASTSMATKEGNEYRKQTIKDQQKKKVRSSGGVKLKEADGKTEEADENETSEEDDTGADAGRGKGNRAVQHGITGYTPSDRRGEESQGHREDGQQDSHHHFPLQGGSGHHPLF